jgi:acyl-CoA thioester hydrolase
MRVKIYYQDTDCGGVVYYANYLVYFERARTEWFAGRGINLGLLSQEGVVFVVSHADITYHHPATLGQELEVEVELAGVGGASLDLHYLIYEHTSTTKIVTGSTRLVCVNKELKPQRISILIREKLAR